ncbi:hypothetical protein, partial [uncultured Demequina sp.]|uniref:hypothetical protein n=1 Tax=uncultured Demequina sp. TaxID=693499 RepID=UPI0025F38B2B
MKVVVIGDIGWHDLYHLGDEAMTEAAVDMLRRRGIADVTLVAGEPEAAERFYGLPAVPRLGFRASWSRERNDAHLAAITSSFDSSDLVDQTAVAAIREIRKNCGLPVSPDRGLAQRSCSLLGRKGQGRAVCSIRGPFLRAGAEAGPGYGGEIRG